VRQYLASAAAAWKSLTDNQRATWRGAVGDNPRKNSIGDSFTLSGFGLFVSHYKTAKDIIETPLDAYAGSEGPVGLTSLSGALTYGPDKLTLTWAPAIPVGEKWKVFATPPHSLGKDFVKSEYRQIALLSSADASPLDIASNYVTKFGAIPQSGEACHVKIVPVLKSTYKAGAALAKTVK
jgi:hypothetical protein